MVDLFSGAGGLSAGFSRAGYRLIGGVEHWEPAAKSLQVNHPNAYVETRDIQTVDASEFLSRLASRPHLVLGGPSCQGFSTSGGLSRSTGRQLEDERNSLFLDFVRFVDVLQPEWVVMENVPGLLLFNRGLVAKEVIKQFRIVGYHVAPIILLAADFGVPQLRRRLFFVGNRTGAKIPFPVPTNGNPNLWKDFALPFEHLSRIGNKSTDMRLSPHVSFEDACGDLPPIMPGGEDDRVVSYTGQARSEYQRMLRGRARKVTLHYAFQPTEFERRAMEYLKPGQNWTALPSELKIGRFAKIRPYDATTLLRRLSSDLPAYTINTKFNDSTTGAYIHPNQNRTLSLREAARLQSFPDSYIFTGSVSEIRKQIGNAVPPLLAERIGRAIRRAVFADIGLEADPADEYYQVLVDAHQEVDALIGLKAPRSKKMRAPENQLSLFPFPV
ncbi:MAG: DNA cytosine methyltransferase [Magnetococcus sp. YQC-9]